MNSISHTSNGCARGIVLKAWATAGTQYGDDERLFVRHEAQFLQDAEFSGSVNLLKEGVDFLLSVALTFGVIGGMFFAHVPSKPHMHAWLSKISYCVGDDVVGLISYDAFIKQRRHIIVGVWSIKQEGLREEEYGKAKSQQETR